MSALIKKALSGLTDSVDLLDIAIEEKPRASNAGSNETQEDLFGTLRAVRPSAANFSQTSASTANSNAANVEQIDAKAFAARLDNAIGRVEEMLKEGRA